MKWITLIVGLLAPAPAFAQVFPAQCVQGSAILSPEAPNGNPFPCDHIVSTPGSEGVQLIQFTGSQGIVGFAVRDVDHRVMRVYVSGVQHTATDGICTIKDREVVCGGGYNGAFVVVKANVTGPPVHEKISEVTSQDCEIPQNLPPLPEEEPCPSGDHHSGQDDIDNEACEDSRRAYRSDKWVQSHKALMHECYVKYSRGAVSAPRTTQQDVIINKMISGVPVMPDELKWSLGY